MKKIEKIEIVICIILVLVFGGTTIYSNLAKKEAEANRIDNTVTALNDINRYLTIDSSVSKYISYVSSKNNDYTYQVLDKNYLEDNNITTVNLFNKIVSYDLNYRGNAKEIYQVSTYQNIYKYYIKEQISNETLDTLEFIRYDYFCVTLDENNLTFAIMPITEDDYNTKIGVSNNG